MNLKIDPEFTELLCELSKEEFAELELNILNFGILDPIKIWQDPDTNKWLIADQDI